MHSALYYPGWGIADPRFLFESLLYWDRLACIVPFADFKPDAFWPGGFEREAQELHERFVTGLPPSEDAKDAVHRRLRALLDTEPPAWCRAENLAPDSSALLSTRKLSPKTVTMLSSRGWLANQEDDSPALISRAAAGVVLGTLAAEMASKTMPALTDNRGVFTATCNGLLRELQSRCGVASAKAGELLEVGPGADEEEIELAMVLARIVKLGLGEAEVTPQMLRRLSALREDAGFNEQRERFCAQVDQYVDDLRSHPRDEHPLVHEHWEQKLSVDRNALKRELRSAGIKSVVDKEGIVATAMGAVVGAGSLATAGPIGLLVGIGIAGAGILDSTRRRRGEVATDRWTSWLVAASNPRPVPSFH